ncbi:MULTISPECIES: hypothetical protein [Thermofilum]|uniref:Uncharacterized protein n=1 Tax=Thermofilum adornatum TaxID=1365176 RepID=S5ZXH0_9CREN|nr:hypothetical protein [Thermofilum adornatum]AGT36039.1 hypothetical protein N186_08505 [Thermofilum adornatum]
MAGGEKVPPSTNISTNKAREIPEALRLFGAESTAEVLKDDIYTLTIRVAVKGPLYRTEKDTSYVRLDISIGKNHC